MLDGLANPRELQPDPLLIVIELQLLSRLMIVVLQIVPVTLQTHRLLIFFNIKFDLFLRLILVGLFFIVALVRLKRERLLFAAFFMGIEVNFEIFFDRRYEEVFEFLLVGNYAHIYLLDIYYGITGCLLELLVGYFMDCSLFRGDNFIAFGMNNFLSSSGLYWHLPLLFQNNP